MNERIKEIKKRSMVKIISHGAYGESESYWQLDEDKLIQLVSEEIDLLEAKIRYLQDPNKGPSLEELREMFKDYPGPEISGKI